MYKRYNNRAWLLVLPVLVLVAMSAVIPLMTVVNYSVQDIFDVNTKVYVGLEWFIQIVRDPQLHAALLRQILFSLSILIIEIPLGILIAKSMPRQGGSATALLIFFAIPLLIPWNVVGTIWQIFARPDIGMAGMALNAIGFDYNYTADPVDAWFTLLALDVWHWTSLVVLLVFSGLRAIPDAYYEAAQIDGANQWQIFWHIELPKLKTVLGIGVLLRLMDSLMIYTEPFVLTGGGPGNATTFLSQYLTRMAVGQFDLGPAAAFSLIYFIMILTLCWLFYSLINPADENEPGHHE